MYILYQRITSCSSTLRQPKLAPRDYPSCASSSCCVRRYSL